ncbi:MAG: alanine dehydrogenase [Bacillota bacterium]|nr:alanine dehydrogenase [Bacillota bacterium]
MGKNIGFPKMHKEINEIRAFLPAFFGELKESDIEIWLENDYGKEMGFAKEDYLKENGNIIFDKKEVVYSRDIVIVLRAPINEELKSMKRDSVLISMLHYITRERRNLFMEQLGIIPYSMDSMVDDDNRRVVVNNYETSFNGAKIAIEQLENELNVVSIDRPINVAIIGMGEIGLTVARAFKDLSNERLSKLRSEYNGLKITMLTRSITGDSKLLVEELRNADILVDASSRNDTSKYIVGNRMIKELPAHAVVLDITADPYDFGKYPPQVKAIEGIPTGTLDQIVFEINNEAYEEINDSIATTDRRTVVSCNAWPGVNPVTSMGLYGRQLLPILKVLINTGHENLDVNSKGYYERILYRSSYEYFKNL